jgi:glycosyltransferase involved in cell wall biosynthesis
MKIGQISKHYYPITGGQQTYIQNLIEVFNKNEIESTIFQPYAKGASKQSHVVVTSPISILQRLDRYIPNLGWFIFNGELLLVKRKLQEQDILISHYSFHYRSIAWHRKVIVLSHGVLWSSKLKTLFDKTLHKKDVALHNNKKIFIVANDTDFIRRIGIVVPEGTNYFSEVSENVWFIPNCIDDSFFTPDFKIAKEKVLIVPRNIRPDRGIDLAIRAFAIFSTTHAEYTLKIIGGPRKGKYYNYCKSLVATLAMSNLVVFEGSKDWKSMRDVYRAAALTIIPSIEKEGTSLSALESMGCGTPVVGTDVAGLKDLPILKSQPTPEDLAQKLSEAIGKIDSLAAEQHEWIRTTFNLRNWEKAWMEVIKKVYNTNSN